jgi:hypothetical protein
MSNRESNVIRPDFTASLHRNGGRSISNTMHSLLDALAKMDLEYEEKRDMIASSHCASEFKGRILKKFREHHRARREPYLAQLVILQGNIGTDRPSP